MAFGRGQFLHDVGQVGWMHTFKFLVSDAQLHAAKRVGLNQIDELPGNHACRQLGGDSPNHARRGDPVKQSSGGARESHINMGNAQFDGSIGALFGKIDVIDADNFSAARIDNLLVEQILANGEPALIGAVMLELFFFNVQL